MWVTAAVMVGGRSGSFSSFTAISTNLWYLKTALVLFNNQEQKNIIQILENVTKEILERDYDDQFELI